MSCGDCGQAANGNRYHQAGQTIYFHILAGIGFSIGAIIIGLILRMFGVRLGGIRG